MKKLHNFTKVFKLYKRAKEELTQIEKLRGNIFGISVYDDKYAKRWQSIRMRVELLESFLESRNPNWYYATYLDNTEKQRRNDNYESKSR